MTPIEYEYLSFLSDVLPEGDVIIGGTWRGDDVRAISNGNPFRNIIVIDSFGGLAPPTENDFCENQMEEKECDIGGKEKFIETFTELGVLPPEEIYEMWISKKTLSIIEERPIALLFLDLDHYQPTKDCMEYFSSWMIKGGVILVHDYDFIRCPGIKKSCDEFGGEWEVIPETGFAKLRIK